MKIIISHDVDHLWRNDHYGDLIYPKQFIRDTISLIKGRITLKTWRKKCASIFYNKHNYVEEVAYFDKEKNVKSTFFFGMAKGLGMSYKSEKTVNYIKFLKKMDLDYGVHGICFNDLDGIRKEYDEFIKINGKCPRGIRMHYVRFNDKTFEYLSETGYVYDSTEFNKADGCSIKNPYKVGKMWEFPLGIMDSYLPDNLQLMKDKTIELINDALNKKLDYLSILFHDAHFCEAYREIKIWYEWLIDYLKEEGYEFISFEEAVDEMNAKEAVV